MDRTKRWLAARACSPAGAARAPSCGRRCSRQVPAGVRLDCEEVYGPVVSLYRVASLDEAIDRANAVKYGLHAAIFTESLRDAFTAVSASRSVP